MTTRERWTEPLRAPGFTREHRRRWRRSFGRHAPDRHRELLELPCIPEKDIAAIRGWAGDASD